MVDYNKVDDFVKVLCIKFMIKDESEKLFIKSTLIALSMGIESATLSEVAENAVLESRKSLNRFSMYVSKMNG